MERTVPFALIPKPPFESWEATRLNVYGTFLLDPIQGESWEAYNIEVSLGSHEQAERLAFEAHIKRESIKE